MVTDGCWAADDVVLSSIVSTVIAKPSRENEPSAASKVFVFRRR